MEIIRSVSELGLGTGSRVLVIMPHPDDEAVFASGLISGCTHRGISLRVVTCTVGEGSTLRHGLVETDDLADVRKRELITALQILRVKSWSIWNFPDGGLEKRLSKLKKMVADELSEYQPTDIFCLEPDGIYGHPDHIALTEAVIACVKKPQNLWFLTVAPWYGFPTARHMAKKAIIQPLAAQIQLKLGWWQVWLKFLALSAHRSQFKLLPWQGTTFKHFLDNSTWTSEFFTLKQ